MQLVAYGAQDIYLTGNPQITFFKIVYRRHTNFSMETISQSLNGNSTLGSSKNNASCTISRNGDLIYKMYITSSSSNIHSGSKIIKSVELEIGGQMIDKHTEEWNNVWNELTIPDSKSPGLKAMQCEDGSSINSDIGLGMVQVPLNFYFCRNPGLALPLIALQYHEVKINFIFGTISDVGTNATIRFFVDYIYLDTDERRRFAQVPHEYLIEQVQMQAITNNTNQELFFNHPIKELIWTTDLDYKYSTAILKFNGLDRFEKQEEEYFQLRQPFDHHTTVPRVNLTISNQLPRSFVEKDNLLIDIPANGLPLGVDDATTELDNIFNIFDGNQTDGTGGNLTTSEDGPVYCFAKKNLKEGGQNIFQHDLLLFIGTGTNFGPFPDATITSVESSVLFNASSDPNLNDINFNSSGANPAVDDTNICFQLTTNIFHTTTENPLTQSIHGGRSMITLTAIHKIIPSSRAKEAYTSKFNKKINVYSFALKPEEHQPSGTCNFSRIDTAILEFGATPTGTNHIYAVNYNVLRIMSGMGGLAYSN